MNNVNPNRPTEADTRAELTRLWLKSLPVLETFVRGSIRDRDAREDVVQATAEQVSRSFDEYDRDRPFSAWVIGIAKFRVLTYYRTQQRERLTFGEHAIEVLTGSAVLINAEIDDRMEALEFCMDKLDSKHRKLLRLRYVEDRQPMDLADQLGSTPNAVSAMVRRLRLALANCIDKRLRREGA